MTTRNTIFNGQIFRDPANNVLGGLNNVHEGYVYDNQLLPLGSSAGDIAVFKPIIVPQGFYLRLLNLQFVGDGDTSTISTIATMTPQGVPETPFDQGLTPSGGNPAGLILISRIGNENTVNQFISNDTIIPPFFQVNAQVFNVTGAAAQNILYTFFGVLLRDINDDCLRVFR